MIELMLNKHFSMLITIRFAYGIRLILSNGNKTLTFARKERAFVVRGSSITKKKELSC